MINPVMYTDLGIAVDFSAIVAISKVQSGTINQLGSHTDIYYVVDIIFHNSSLSVQSSFVNINSVDRSKVENDFRSGVDSLIRQWMEYRNPSPEVSQGPLRDDGKYTIKQMATTVINDCTTDMTCTMIREAIKSRFNVDVKRTSLTPQLNRLVKEKILSTKKPGTTRNNSQTYRLNNYELAMSKGYIVES